MSNQALAAVSASEEASQLAYAGATGRRRGVGRLWLGLRRAQLGQSVFDHCPQRLRFEGAGTQIGRDAESGLGGAAVELRALRLAHADGNASGFQIPLNGRGRKTIGFGFCICADVRRGVRGDVRCRLRGCHRGVVKAEGRWVG